MPEEAERGGRLVVEWHGEIVVDVPPRTVAHEGPVYQRPFARPSWQDALQADDAEKLPRPATGDELRETLLRLVASPNLCDRSWITDQYDRYVLGNTVLAQPEDAGMVRVDEETGLGVALATDCNGRFAKLDPYAGAQLALAESYRNVAVSGARPLAVSDCLNFGSPEDPDVMWQFAEAVRGLADGCQELGIPVTGGNVSLYNQTGETAILPTPGRGGARRHRRRDADGLRAGFARRGQRSSCSGRPARSCPGSEWAHVVHGHLGGLPAGGRPRRRAGAGRHARAAPRRTGWSTPPTTCPTAGSRRRSSRPACGTASAPASSCRGPRPVRGAVRRVGRPRDRGASSRRTTRPVPASCAPQHGCPVTELGVSEDDRWRRRCRHRPVQVPLAELREAWSATLRAALA